MDDKKSEELINELMPIFIKYPVQVGIEVLLSGLSCAAEAYKDRDAIFDFYIQELNVYRGMFADRDDKDGS